MNQANRLARNKERLAELYPAFAIRVERVIVRLQDAGLKPRIQDAWRSPADQLIAFNAGRAKVRYGFHNVTGSGGQKEALAVDLLDDDSPLDSRKPYLLQLAAVARQEGLDTGIGWGLPVKLREGVDAAIATGHWQAEVKIGWDPTHVQPVGITLAEARQGKRPT